MSSTRTRSRLAAALLTAAATVASLSFAATAEARTTLQQGDRGQDVGTLTTRLAKHGYLPADQAGTRTFGPRVFHAVVAFQKVRELGRDGVAGPLTQKALREHRGARPRIKGASSGRRIEVDKRKQVALLIEDGKVERVIAVSTAAPGYSTPSGTHRVFRKELRSWSVPYRVWLPYASYFVGGVAFHAYPSVPTTPASHGCVRVPEPFAPALYSFARMGTRVDVLG